MRKLRIVLVLFLISLFCIPLIKVKADPVSPSLDDYSDVTEIADEALKLDIKVTDQYYPSKKIKVELTILPSIDSGRTAVDWITNANILKPEDLSRDLVDLNANQTITLTKILDPQTQYSLKDLNATGIAVKVTAAAYAKNYISVKKGDFNLNNDFEITPLLSTYQSQKNVFQLLSWILGIVVTLVLIALITIGVQKFIVYLNTEEEH
jgi:hypothetical protein